MLTEAGGPTKTLRGWLRRPRNTVAILSWAGFALLMVAVGVGRVADHRPFGSWVATVTSPTSFT
jgi:hypothetical protein